MIKTCIGVAIVAGLFATGAVAAQTEGTAAPTSTAKPKKEKKVCRSVEVTGSILGQSVCHTAAEWAAMSGRGQRNQVPADLGSGASDVGDVGKR
ncbi:hypothetical protein [Sphingomonas glacialis]|uniref:Secreted protein n=1 Tax=Sphingomonas glacialis TaxID=658225 RepID=A0A502FSB2_9SPHN|nr:hypothetical protein [Sphingomonas glacialis]TPG52036.1 hypothetical protein EAH76_15050 [Sphingomonas glacialis]